MANMYEPEVSRRMARMKEAQAKGDESGTSSDERANDLMQWLIEQSLHSSDPAERNPRNLSNKLVMFNLFGESKHARMMRLRLQSC